MTGTERYYKGFLCFLQSENYLMNDAEINKIDINRVFYIEITSLISGTSFLIACSTPALSVCIL